MMIKNTRIINSIYVFFYNQKILDITKRIYIKYSYLTKIIKKFKQNVVALKK